MTYYIYPNLKKSLIEVGYYIFDLDEAKNEYETYFDPVKEEECLIFQNLQIENLEKDENTYISIFDSYNVKIYDNFLEDNHIVKTNFRFLN